MTRKEYEKLKKLIELWNHCDEGIQYVNDFEQGIEVGLERAADDLKYFLDNEIDIYECEYTKWNKKEED